MLSNKIIKSILLAGVTIIIAYLMLLFPLVNKETSQNTFNIYPKKFEYSSELKEYDKNISFIKAEKVLNEGLYDAGEAFETIALKDAWETSSPRFFTYIKNKKNSVYSNTSHEFLLQTLSVLYDFILAYEKSKDNRFLVKGYEIIDEWYDHSSRFYPFQSPLVWNDHVVSERIIAILSFYDYAMQFINIDPEKKVMINQIAKDSILFLASPYNYKYKHNHGIYEDFALMIAVSHLQNKDLQKKYYDIAIQRFQQQVLETLDKNGIHLENSPKYHLIITDLLNDFIKYTKNLNLTIDDEILRRINLANKNKYFFVLNNGYIPPVGDSPYVPYNDFLKSNNDLLVSQDGGYVIYKDENFYLLLRSQSISHVHAHQDQLSFIYEDNKHLIVSDPGFLDYSSTKENLFLHSPQAHNTIYVPHSKRKRIYTFTHLLNNKQFFYCQISSLDKNISREFLLDKASKILLVQDTIDVHKENKVFEILNLGKEVVGVKSTEKYQKIIFEDGYIYYIGSKQNNSFIKTDILNGSKKPYMGGWRAVTYKKLVPSYTLWSELNKKKNIKFTRVTANKPIDSLDLIQDHIEVSINGTKKQFDLNIIKTQAQLLKKSELHHPIPESNEIVGKVKKKIAPLFYKRIKIFINESFLILLLMLLYILIRNRYTKLLFLVSCIVVGLFDMLVFINT